MANNEITILPTNLLESFIESNNRSIKMLSDLIDNTIERQYILMSDTLNILENSRQQARSNHNVFTTGRHVTSHNRSNRYYNYSNRSPIRRRPYRHVPNSNFSVFSPTPPPPPPRSNFIPNVSPPPPPPPLSTNTTSLFSNLSGRNIGRPSTLSSLFRNINNNNTNRSFRFTFGEFQPDLTSVPIIPTSEQISNATIIDSFSDISNESEQTRCPIDQHEFDPSDNVMKIIFCGHMFKEHNLRNWFQHSSKCPVCRYDIRDYSNNDISDNDISDNDISDNDISDNDIDIEKNETSDNDVSNNDISNNIINITDINLEVILEDTVRNLTNGPTFDTMVNLANNLANQIIENTDISGTTLTN